MSSTSSFVSVIRPPSVSEPTGSCAGVELKKR